MKRVIILLIILALVLSASALINPLMMLAARYELKKVFSDSNIVIKNSILSINKLCVRDIDIKKNGVYDIKVKEAGIEFSPVLLVKGRISKVYLKGVRAEFGSYKNNIFSLPGITNVSRPAFFSVNTLKVSDLNFILNTSRLSFKLHLSSEVNLMDKSINYIYGNITYLRSAGFSLNNLLLRAHRDNNAGILNIGGLKYNKLAIENIKSRAELNGQHLTFNNFSADTLGGKLKGIVNLKLCRNVKYVVKLKAMRLSIKKIVSDFKLDKNVEASGIINGSVNIKGDSSGINSLSGGFYAAAPGGSLTIKNNNYLKKVSANTGQPLNIILESFRDYRYNKGEMAVGLKGKDIILNVVMEGNKGRRDIKAVLHNFMVMPYFSASPLNTDNRR